MREDYRTLQKNKKILVTGCAGFIGFHLSRALLECGCRTAGLDNMNPYYDVRLKEERLDRLKKYDSFRFYEGDLADGELLERVFREEKPEIVVNLAAQAGVRWSIECPEAYIHSNIAGFFRLLECCRRHPVEHCVYASSSSVYGESRKVPFSEADRTDCPESLYAATKKSNELMAHCYSRLYGLPATGLRFFTVYGPWGRPDMAYYKFAERIMKGERIQLYNYGNMMRDFTYIDDIVGGILRILPNAPLEAGGARAKVYNIGNSRPEKLSDFVAVLEGCLGRRAEKELLPVQPGDVLRTCADISQLADDFDFRPDTPIAEGLGRFAEWYLGRI